MEKIGRLTASDQMVELDCERLREKGAAWGFGKGRRSVISRKKSMSAGCQESSNWHQATVAADCMGIIL